MKTILTILIMSISVTNFAQDSRLFDNIWYLHNLIIDGENNIPPVNDEIPFVPAEFIKPDVFNTGICESGGGGQIFYNGSSEFTLQDFGFLTGGCYENEPFNEDFNQLYVEIYWFPTSANAYFYTITEDGNNRTLTIVNSNGDEAIYGNELLAVNNFKNEAFSIYPNPTEDIIYVQKKENINLSKILIFDINGKLVQLIEQINSDSLIVNVNALKKGIYFISLKNDKNQYTVKKLIKK